MTTCARPDCDNQFESNYKHQKYCCAACNMADRARLLRVKRAAAKEAGEPRSSYSGKIGFEIEEFHKRFRQQKLRPCLSCNGTFLSDGPGHRICPKCRPRYNYLSQARANDRHRVLDG